MSLHMCRMLSAWKQSRRCHGPAGPPFGQESSCPRGARPDTWNAGGNHRASSRSFLWLHDQQEDRRPRPCEGPVAAAVAGSTRASFGQWRSSAVAGAGLHEGSAPRVSSLQPLSWQWGPRGPNVGKQGCLLWPRAARPRRHGTMQVEPSLTHLTSEVVKTHEGQLRRVRNLWQGPQHFCSSGDAIAFLTAPACLDTFLPVINTARYLHMTRQGEPVTAPVQRQSCRSATPIAACMPTRERMRDCRSMPGTVTIPHGVVGDIKPMRTDAHARSALECLMSQLGAYGTLLHYTITHPERSLLSQHVLSSSAGLPRIEPLLFLRRESVALRDPDSVKSTFHRAQVRNSHVNSYQSRNVSVPTRPRFILNPLLPHMADTGAGEPANQEERADSGTDRPRRSSARRYPRSRARADGTRRRTDAEIEARRKAKREGTGYWATAAARSHSGRPRAGPDHVRSNSRSQKVHEWDKDWGSSHREAAEEWTWQDKEDWWHGSWWNESSWQMKPSVDTPPWRQKFRPSEPRERTTETPQEEARRLILGPSSKGPEDSVPNNSGSVLVHPVQVCCLLLCIVCRLCALIGHCCQGFGKDVTFTLRSADCWRGHLMQI